MTETPMPVVVSGRAATSNWFLSGSCRFSDLGPDAWFPIDRARTAGDEAKALCRVCPVLERCRTESLRIPDVRGIWGGWDESDRRQATLVNT
jgi:WhiB family redox-sensing transcriptional regulator